MSFVLTFPVGLGETPAPTKKIGTENRKTCLSMNTTAEVLATTLDGWPTAHGVLVEFFTKLLEGVAQKDEARCFSGSEVDSI